VQNLLIELGFLTRFATYTYQVVMTRDLYLLESGWAATYTYQGFEQARAKPTALGRTNLWIISDSRPIPTAFQQICYAN
jgi:hypothetical protein